jgi:hypothetical protein
LLVEAAVMTRRSTATAAAFVLVASFWPSAAIGQEKNRFALGANIGVRVAGDSSAARGDTGIGLLWRFGQAHEGWGWRYGLGWYATDVAWKVGSQTAELGRLGVKPLMGGYGYTHVMGRTSVSGTLVGGYAFTSLRPGDGFADSVSARVGAGAVTIDAANTFVVRPGVSVWYNVNEKVGINLSAHYMLSRPRITVTSPAGSDVRRLNADMFSIRVGAVYSLF